MIPLVPNTLTCAAGPRIRRIDGTFPAGLVAGRRIDEDDAIEVVTDRAYRLAKQACRL